jgi:hypothetical protein
MQSPIIAVTTLEGAVTAAADRGLEIIAEVIVNGLGCIFFGDSSVVIGRLVLGFIVTLDGPILLSSVLCRIVLVVNFGFILLIFVSCCILFRFAW